MKYRLPKPLKNELRAFLRTPEGERQIQFILNFIDAPIGLDRPELLVTVARNLIELLPILEKIAPGELSSRDQRSLRAATEALRQLKHDSITEASLIAKIGNPLHGILRSHSLFCGLALSAPQAARSRRYRILQAQMLISVRRLDTLAAGGIQVESTIYGGCLVTRQLASKDNGAVVDALPELALATGSYRDALTGISNAQTPDLQAKLRRIILLLERGLSQVGDKTRGVGRSSPQLDLLSRPTPPSDWRQVQIDSPVNSGYRAIRTGEQPGDHSDQLPGDAPYERMSRTLGIQVLEEESENRCSSPADQMLRSRAAIRYLARDNQQLPLDLSVLQVRVISALHLTLNKMPEKLVSPMPWSALKALAGIICWTGYDLDTTLSIQLTHGGVVLPKDQAAPLLCVDHDIKSCHWIHPVKTILRKSLPKQPSGQEPPTLTLPVPTDLLSLIKPLVRRRLAAEPLDKSQPCPLTRLFVIGKAPGQTFSRECWIEALNELFKTINQQHQTHLTLKRVERSFLHILLHRTEADRVDAQLLTGQTLALASSDAYYQRRNKASLIAVYEDAQQILTDLINGHSESENKRRNHPRYKPSSAGKSGDLFAASKARRADRQDSVGSPYCPQMSEVSRLAEDLRDRIDSAINAPPSPSRLRHIHNAMTAYSLMLCGYAFGFRAVSQPLKCWTDLDRETGVAIVLDKDAGDGYGARIVWAPPVAYDQLMRYQTHCLRLAERWPAFSDDMVQRIYHSLNLELAAPETQSLTPFFLLDSGYRPIPCSPKWMATLLPPPWNGDPHYPLNACRHFLASQFRERGVSPDVVCAFMGHWHLGEEPWVARSALSPQHFRKDLQRVLTLLLNQCGWSARSGLDQNR